jgi:CSLREA domain-containing protein
MRHPRLLGLDHRLRFALIALLMALPLMASMLVPRVALAASFVVTKITDTNDGVCDADCSLREAIVAATVAAGPDMITLPAGTYTLSRTGIDDSAANGDLDVTGPLTINGAGQASTSIQGGIHGGSFAIDKVFSFNPQGAAAGFAVSLNNLTIRFGRNPNAFGSGDGNGGCLDFDGGTSGTGSLSLPA